MLVVNAIVWIASANQQLLMLPAQVLLLEQHSRHLLAVLRDV